MAPSLPIPLCSSVVVVAITVVHEVAPANTAYRPVEQEEHEAELEPPVVDR